ncbi:MAG TPA: D-arabinono-1,4-lactone oxidase [Microlunatus sp.]
MSRPTTGPVRDGWTNWSRTVSSRPAAVATPTDPERLGRLITEAAGRGATIKAVGAGHSFSAIAATDGVQVRLDAMAGLRRVDRESGLVTVGGGTRLADLTLGLASYGLALPNLGDIDRQTIAGAISTGTHGSGNRLGGLATQVRGLTLIGGDGSLLRASASENADVLAAAALGLGALGIVVEVTLQCVPTFLLRAEEGSATLPEVLEQWPTWIAENDHVDLHWFPHTEWVLTKRNNRVDGPPAPLSGWRHLVDDELLANGVLGLINEVGTRRPAWQPRINELAGQTLSPRTFTDHSAAVFVSPRRVRFVECEYAIPRTSLVPVISELRRWIDRSEERIGIPIEIRSAASDDLWLSTGHQRENAYVAVHHYWRQDPTRYFAAFEAIVAEHDGRPHWGKMHSLDADRLRELYPRFDDFLAVRERLDPGRVFTNPYLDRVLGP